MANSDAGNLIEVVDTFRFRNSGSIQIPKAKRQIAYTMAVDVIVESVDFNTYATNKTIPRESFYGNATLVSQDSIMPKVPLRFGRNRIYYERNEQAFSQWEFHRQYYVIDDQLRFLATITAGIDPSFWLSGFPPSPKFVELPLREVYVEVQDNCQFQIEYCQYQPVPYTNSRGLSYVGGSDQTDGDKDSGLPPEGTQPRQNPPSNPFGNNLPPSSISELGGFYNPKSGLDNPTNEGADNIDRLWGFSFTFDYLNGSGNIETQQCFEFVQVTGRASDAITVQYNEKLGEAADGTPVVRASLIWKGSTVLSSFGGGVVNGSVQQCNRILR